MKTALKNPRIADADLSKLIRAGKRKGAEMLYDTYGNFLSLAISRIVPDRKVADQALLATFQTIWCSINDYVLERESIYTWMIAIARKSAGEALLISENRHEDKIRPLQAHIG